MTETYSTRIVQIQTDAIDPQKIDEAAKLIRAGQLVAFPTETVYGLGANAFDAKAVSHIFEAKGRPSTDPLIVHIWSVDQLQQVAVDIPDLAYKLIEVFWPGALTLLLPRSERIPDVVTARMSTVAVRMPSHPVALALLKAAEVPIAAPSANRFSHTSPTTAQHVYDDLAGKLPLILDGGSTTIGVESTILDIASNPLHVLRPGGISLDRLREIIPSIEVIERFAEPEDTAIAAPGMLLKHYSPRAELRLYEGQDAAICEAMIQTTQELVAKGLKVGLLIAEQDRACLSGMDVSVTILGSTDNLNEIAHNLFAGLRQLDSYAVDVILARSYAKDGIGLALHDRLLRAAEGRVIRV